MIKKVWGHWNFDPLGNILMFFPWTYAICGAFPKFRGNNRFVTVRRSLLVSFVFFAFIESTQLKFSIGTFQVSGLVYNTLSGGLGGFVFEVIRNPSKAVY